MNTINKVNKYFSILGLISIIFIYLVFLNNHSFAAITLGQEIAELKARVATLESTSGSGIPSTFINHYIKTSTCDELTNQPTNACTTGTCYDTDDFLDSNSTSLIGYTFTAVKSTADLTDKDGGIWMCDSANISTLVNITNCTNIGFSRRDGSNTVEFTIPVGATSKKVYALSMSLLGGISSTSALTNFSLCKEVSNTTVISP